MKGVEDRFLRHDDWAWSKEAFVVLPNSALQLEENVFECEVTLPQTRLVRRKITIYSPGRGGGDRERGCDAMHTQ